MTGRLLPTRRELAANRQDLPGRIQIRLDRECTIAPYGHKHAESRADEIAHARFSTLGPHIAYHLPMMRVRAEVDGKLPFIGT